MSEHLGSSASPEAGGSGGIPARSSDIQLEDCTLALLARDKLSGEATTELGDRVIESRPYSVTFGCKACLARLTISGFANVPGALDCPSPFRQEATRIIESQ